MPSLTALSAFWIAVAACAVAQAAIVRAVLVPSAPPAPAPRPVLDVPSPPEGDGADGVLSRSSGASGAPRTVRELVWGIVPGIALALVFVWTWQVMHTPSSPRQGHSQESQRPASATGVAVSSAGT